MTSFQRLHLQITFIYIRANGLWDHMIKMSFIVLLQFYYSKRNGKLIGIEKVKEQKTGAPDPIK